MSKESFLIYKSFYEPIKDLPNEQLGELFRAIYLYQITGEEPQPTSIIFMPFQFFKNQFRLDGIKYEKVVNRNKSNGSNGGRPKTQNNPKNPVGFTEPKKPDNDNEKDNDNVNVKDKELLNNTYQLCVDFWLKDFHTDFTFNATSGKKMKSIIKQFQVLLKNNGKEVSVNTLFESFKIMCQKLPEWYRNKDLSVIDSKFNEIIQEIKNGTTNTKQEQRKDAAAEAIRLLTGTELR